MSANMKMAFNVAITLPMSLGLLASSCTANNNAMKIPESQTKVAATDGAVSSKKDPSAVTENEVMEGWLKESLEQRIVADKLGMPERKGVDVYSGALGTYSADR